MPQGYYGFPSMEEYRRANRRHRGGSPASAIAGIVDAALAARQQSQREASDREERMWKRSMIDRMFGGQAAGGKAVPQAPFETVPPLSKAPGDLTVSSAPFAMPGAGTRGGQPVRPAAEPPISQPTGEEGGLPTYEPPGVYATKAGKIVALPKGEEAPLSAIYRGSQEGLGFVLPGIGRAREERAANPGGAIGAAVAGGARSIFDQPVPAAEPAGQGDEQNTRRSLAALEAMGEIPAGAGQGIARTAGFREPLEKEAETGASWENTMRMAAPLLGDLETAVSKQTGWFGEAAPVVNAMGDTYRSLIQRGVSPDRAQTLIMETVRRAVGDDAEFMQTISRLAGHTMR